MLLSSGAVSAAGPASSVRIVSEDERGIILEISVPQPRLDTRGETTDVSIRGFGTLTEPTRPALPVRAERIAIPAGAQPVIVSVEGQAFPLGTMIPSPFPTVLRPNGPNGTGGSTVRVLRRRDGTIYGGKDPFPSAPVHLGTMGAFREVPFVELIVSPVVFEPHSARLSWYPKLTVRLDWGVAASPPSASPGPAIGEAEDDLTSLARAFVNPRLARSIARAEREALRPGPPASAATVGGSSLSEPTASGGESAARSSASPSTSRAAASATVSSSTRYKLTVNKDGIYRLDYAWVSANAPDLLNFPPSRYRLMDMGVEVPITVTDSDADGTFESVDTIEFVGQKLAWDILDPDDWQQGDWTDDNVYWLDAGPSAGLRISTRDGTPSGSAVVTDFAETAHHEVDNMFIQSAPYDTADHWHERPSISAVGAAASQTFTVSTPDPTTTSGAVATIKVKLLADAFATYHRSNIYVSNKQVDGCSDGAAGCGNEGGGCVDWDGFIEFTHGQTNGPVHFCQSDLSASTSVKVELPLGRVVNGQPVNGDTVYLDWVEIGYQRMLKVSNEMLTFTLGNTSTKARVSGLATNKAALYEITKTLSGGQLLSPVRITNFTFALNGSTYDLSFNVAADGTLPPTRRFMVATITSSTSTGDLTPASVRVYTPSDIRNPSAGADWLVVGDSDLMDSSPTSGFQNLIAYRRDTQGKRVRTVTVEQVYDEFSWGILDPQAIRDFLQYAYNNWPQGPGGKRLSQVVLLGDATFDTKNNYGASQKRIWVPTYMRTISANTITGYYSDDVYFARVVGTDELPDLYLGRLPTHSMTETNNTCQKILDYEQQPKSSSTAWQHNVVLTAENKDSSFKQVSEDTRMTYLVGTAHTYNRVYEEDLDPLFPDTPEGDASLAAEVKSRMQKNLNGYVDPSKDIGPGAAVFTFVGHGSWQNWAQDHSVFVTASSTSDDLDPLVDQGKKQPFLFVSNCLSGGFHVTNCVSCTNPPDLTYAFTEDWLTTVDTSVNPYRYKGTIAALAPAHLTYLFNLSVQFDSVFGAMYGDSKERNVGRVAQALREAFADNLAYVDVRSFSLLADPATTLIMPAPKPPTGVHITSEGDHQVSLAWTTSPEASSYRIYRTDYPGNSYVLAGSTSGTSFTDSSLTNCKTYYYRVASLDSGGFEGAVSNFNTDCPGAGDCVSGTPRKPSPPSAPTGLALTDRGTGDRMNASWNANQSSDEVTDYVVRWSTISGDPNPPNQTSTTGTSTTLVGLADGVPIYVTVSGENCSQGEGPHSTEVRGVPHNTRKGIRPPMWISNLKVERFRDTGDGKDDAKLSWTLPGVDIYGEIDTLSAVRVYHNTTGPLFPLDAAHLLATLASNATSFIHEDAFFDASRHYYLVVLVDSAGNLSGGGHNLIRGIDDLFLLRVGSTQLRLSWSAPTLDMSGQRNRANQYRVYGSPTLFTRAQTGGMTPVTTTGATTVTLGLPADSIYYYSVIAEDRQGNQSPW